MRAGARGAPVEDSLRTVVEKVYVCACRGSVQMGYACVCACVFSSLLFCLQFSRTRSRQKCVCVCVCMFV